MVDLGGGSTEFVLGNADGVIAARSVDVGCVRMTERHLRSDPPTADQIAAAEADVDAAISEAAQTVPLERTAAVVGVAGSVTTITAHALRLPEYSAGRDPRHRTGPGRDPESLHRAARNDPGRAGRAALHAPRRVDVIGAGGLVWRRVLQRLAEVTGGRITTAVSSEHDILDGIALSIR